jgi:putative hemolysin
MPPSAWLAALFLLLAAFFCAVELCVLLVHRLRLQVLEEAGNRRARLVNRLLEKQDLAAMSATVGVELSIAGTAASSWYLGASLELGTGGRIGVELAAVLVLLLLVTLLPRIVVPARPTRTLVLLAYPFALACRLFYPLCRALLALRDRCAARAPRESSHLETHPSLVFREDLRKLISRPELAILGEREREIALKLFRFGGALVRDLMTPSADVVALAEGSTVADLHELVRAAGFTRIPIFRESKENLVGLVNVHDVLDQPPERGLEGFVRPAPRVAPSSLAHSLFVHLQRTPHWMAFVEVDGRSVGIVTVEDLVEEILGDIYDEFELPRPRYVPAGRRRLRASGLLSLEELGRDLGLGRSDLPDKPIAAAIRDKLGRPPQEDEVVDIEGLRLQVRRVRDGEAAEVEVGRHG